MEKNIIKVIFSIIIVLFLVMLFYKNFIIYKIDGNSMNPTLYHSELVLAQRNPKTINRKDIISFKKEGYDLAIKRVIGIPGDTIDIKEDGTILVNNEIIDEPYLSSKSIDKVEVIFPITLDEDEYFVLGDNRIDSFDSKNYKIGNVKREEIIAKIIFKLNTFKKL